MSFERWDIIAVPAFVLGLPDEDYDHYGVVISSRATLEGAGRYWILQIPNPAPLTLVDGDIEVPYLGQILPPKPAVVRTSSIFAAHYLDLDDEPITQLLKEFRRPVMAYIDRFLPRRA